MPTLCKRGMGHPRGGNLCIGGLGDDSRTFLRVTRQIAWKGQSHKMLVENHLPTGMEFNLQWSSAPGTNSFVKLGYQRLSIHAVTSTVLFLSQPWIVGKQLNSE